MLSKTEIHEIAETFLSEMNPTGWNGIGNVPVGFDQRVMSFPLSEPDGVRLDISFELIQDDDVAYRWEHHCEIVDEATNKVIDCCHGYGIDSIDNLEDTIEYLLEVNNINPIKVSYNDIFKQLTGHDI